MIARMRRVLKYVFAPVLYRFPPIGLQPSELGVYLHELLNHSNVAGDVAEIGCSLGGTACLAARLVKQYAPNKKYVCYDTFSGFVREQIEKDINEGTPESTRFAFTGTSYKLVRRILNLHGCDEVRLVKGDIATIPDSELSECYSVVLLDVDLSEPTYVALKRIYPKLSRGGIILVDDCRPDPNQRWKALKGVQRFCEETGVVAKPRFGFSIIEKIS